MDDMITDLKNQGLHPIALTPHADTAIADYIAKDKEPLIVLGNEGTGLPQEIIQQCEPLKIPMANQVDSLNVAAAAAVCLYEATRQRACVN